MDVSVIIPVYNAENTIGVLLEALNKQDYKDKFEVILVDDASSDNTEMIIKEYLQKDLKYSIEFLKQNHSGPGEARNTGIAKSNCEYIAFIDADCVPVEDWLTAILSPFFNKTNDRIIGVGGTYRTKNPESLVARYIGYDIEYRHAQFKEEIDFAGTYSAAFKREAVIDAGMFSKVYTEANAEDNELSYRLIDKGYIITYNPKAIVYHPHPDSLKKLIKQQYKRATWRVKLTQRNKSHKKDKFTNFTTIIQPFVWGLLPIYICLGVILFLINSVIPFSFLHFISFGIGLIFLVILIYFLLNLDFLSWIREQKKEKYRVIILIFGLILIRTLSWFFGGIAGTYRFVIRRK